MSNEARVVFNANIHTIESVCKFAYIHVPVHEPNVMYMQYNIFIQGIYVFNVIML